MAIKFQYNKTSFQQMEKQLKIRVRALPTIKNKESALRMEVKRAKKDITDLKQQLEEQIKSYDNMIALWNEFEPSLVTVKDVHLSHKKIAGVKIPQLDSVEFQIKPFSVFSAPKWYLEGIENLKSLAEVGIRRVFCELKLDKLEYARKKTTQKVNLFEKVQIPGYQNAILKIKRYLEDEENLSKSSQKIMKSHQVKQEEEVEV